MFGICDIRRLLSALVILSVLSPVTEGQEIKIRQISLKEFPVISFMVSIETAWGAPVLIEPKNLRLYEDGKAVPNAEVQPHGDANYPIYSVLVIDKSGSMRGEAIEQAKQGALMFTKSMKDKDKVALVEFDTQVNTVSEFSSDKEALAAIIRGIRTGTDTALIDAVWEAVELFQNPPPDAVRIALVMTDGKENRSKQDIGKTIESARTSGISIYTIGLGNDIDQRMLRDIAEKTEANYYHVPEPKDLVDIYRRISQLLHSQLRITYRTGFPMDDSWRVLRVVAPYMSREIHGERSYLSALESRIPTDVLKKMREDEREEAERAIIERLIKENRERQQRRVRHWIFILGGGATALLGLLIAVLLRRRRR